jgi:hypothetical protein
LILSTLVEVASSATISVTEPSGTGTRMAMPSIFPANSGMTSAVAFAAPVVVGIMDKAPARPRRRWRVGLSRMDWLAV